MAETALRVSIVADTTELKSGLAEATKATEQFSAKGKQLAEAGTTMSNGLKQVGTAAEGLKGKLGGFANELEFFADELAAGVGPVDALASRIPLLIKNLSLLAGPIGRLAGQAVSVLVGNLLTLGVQALTSAEKVKTLKDVGSDLNTAFKDWKTAAADLEKSFQQLGSTTNAAALQIRRGFVNELGLARSQIISEFKQLPIAVGNEMLKFKGMFDPVVNVMKDLSPWVQKTLVGFRTLGGSMQATTPQARALLDVLQGMKSLGATKTQLDGIAVAMNNVNKAAASGDIPAMSSAMLELANRTTELLTALGATPAQIAAVVGQLYELAESSRTAAGSVSVLTQSLIDLVKARNALSSSGGAALGGFAGGDIDLLTRKYTDHSVQLKQMQKDAQAFWTTVQTEGDKASREVLTGYIPAQDQIKTKLAEVKKAYETLGTRATAEDTRNFNNAIAELNGQLGKLAGGGVGGGGVGGGGGGGGSLGKAASGVKKLGEEMKAAEDPMKEFQDGLASVMESLGSGVVDALFSIAEGSKSAKEAFTDLAKSMLKQIAQLIVQMLILKPLMGLFGGGLGGGIGLFGGGGGASIYAGSGIALLGSRSSRQSTIGTYDGFSMSPSAVAAVKSSAVSSSSSQMHQAPMNVTVNNNSSAVVKTRQETDGLYIDLIEEVVSDRITRGGNKIDAAMRRAFGAKRIGY